MILSTPNKENVLKMTNALLSTTVIKLTTNSVIFSLNIGNQ